MTAWWVVGYLLVGVLFTRRSDLLDILCWPVNMIALAVADVRLTRAKRAKAKRLEPERLARIEQMLSEQSLSVDQALDWAASGEWPR